MRTLSVPTRGYCHVDGWVVLLLIRSGYTKLKSEFTDTPGAGPMDLPTRANLVRGMQWLVRDARPNDSLFFQ